MAFSYTPANNMGAPGIDYSQKLNYGQSQGQSVQQPQQQPSGQSIDPMRLMKMYQQFAGAGSQEPASGLSGLLSSEGGSAGLGGSGLIGSAGGAASAAETGGAGFGLGGSLVGGSGTVGGSTFAAGSGAAGAGAAGGAAGGGAAAGGMGGAIAAGGPWAALAAIIMGNEEHSRKKGLRAEDRGERTRDQLTGKVVTQDIEGKWGPMFDKWTGDNYSKLGFQGDASGASQVASGRIGPGLKTIWNEGTLSKIRDIF